MSTLYGVTASYVTDCSLTDFTKSKVFNERTENIQLGRGARREILVAVMKCMMTMKILRQCLVQFVTVINTLMDGFCPLEPGYWWTSAGWGNLEECQRQR